MIRFSLYCSSNHEFEGWFRNNADFDSQLAAEQIRCPLCNSTQVQKSLMAPAVSTGRQQEKIADNLQDTQKRLVAEIQDQVRKFRQNADYVGDKFAEEARKIHFGETETRGIYGKATTDEVSSLLDDGVEVMSLPSLPEDNN